MRAKASSPECKVHNFSGYTQLSPRRSSTHIAPPCALVSGPAPHRACSVARAAPASSQGGQKKGILPWNFGCARVVRVFIQALSYSRVARVGDLDGETRPSRRYKVARCQLQKRSGNDRAVSSFGRGYGPVLRTSWLPSFTAASHHAQSERDFPPQANLARKSPSNQRPQQSLFKQGGLATVRWETKPDEHQGV
ncbi:hypothetical protein C8R45DRAFT_361545 [Mycena sanguinolenta]|nr:hypothetical protein C8R45DRAFT_361545 [Mycena sanguinolenta]